MNTKWTPGPLTVGKDSIQVLRWGMEWEHYTVTADTGKLRQDSVDGKDTIHLCTARCSKEVDARLYALAPEMAEALRECADWLCDCEPHTDQWERGQKARALLAKLEA